MARKQAPQNEVIQIDRFVPNYKNECENCGRIPTISMEKDGKIIHETTLCGPCTWGEMATADPKNWN